MWLLIGAALYIIFRIQNHFMLYLINYTATLLLEFVIFSLLGPIGIAVYKIEDDERNFRDD